MLYFGFFYLNLKLLQILLFTNIDTDMHKQSQGSSLSSDQVWPNTADQFLQTVMLFKERGAWPESQHFHYNPGVANKSMCGGYVALWCAHPPCPSKVAQAEWSLLILRVILRNMEDMDGSYFT